MIADELRRQADNFIELDELREVIGRPPREPRPEARGNRSPGQVMPRGSWRWEGHDPADVAQAHFAAPVCISAAALMNMAA